MNIIQFSPCSVYREADHNKGILEIMRGIQMQPGTPETDNDPRNPNVRSKMFWSHHHQRNYETFEELVMADFSKLMADLAALSAKVDALMAKQNPPPVDEQPQVDAADQAVEAIAAKIPS